jgi:hypothetical protein
MQQIQIQWSVAAEMLGDFVSENIPAFQGCEALLFGRRISTFRRILLLPSFTMKSPSS